VLAQAAPDQTASVEAAQRALQIANDRYTGGLVTYLDVINAEQTLLDSQRLAHADSRPASGDLCRVGQALGGGWDASSLQAFQVKPR